MQLLYGREAWREERRCCRGVRPSGFATCDFGGRIQSGKLSDHPRIDGTERRQPCARAAGMIQIPRTENRTLNGRHQHGTNSSMIGSIIESRVYASSSHQVKCPNVRAPTRSTVTWAAPDTRARRSRQRMRVGVRAFSSSLYASHLRPTDRRRAGPRIRLALKEGPICNVCSI